MVDVIALGDDSPLPDWDDPWAFTDEDIDEIRGLFGGRWAQDDVRDPDGAQVLMYGVQWLAGPRQYEAWSEFGFDAPDQVRVGVAKL